MTEGEAQQAIEAKFGREVLDQVARFLEMVAQENGSQNLVAASTLTSIWSRHAWDSLQLLERASNGNAGVWIDIGSGGGFPGFVVGLARSGRTVLVEPRRRRAEFLTYAAQACGVDDRVVVVQRRMEQVAEQADFISARAVAAIEALFDMAHQCASATTQWLLPRGRVMDEEIAALRQRWRFMFHVEQSDVAADSAIVIFEKVSRR